MELEETTQGPVDPEVRAYVYSLVSALGGTGAHEDGRYVLGDDALACLKDLKKWLKLHDEKANRLDVARCLAEANLVKGDLLEILATWPESPTEDKIKLKIALACLELLVPLTWPIEKNHMQMTVNHHRHVPYLQLAQTSYKRAILEHESAEILRTAVRIGLPSIALPRGERSARDDGIIKLLLYFFRNVAMISAPPNLPDEGAEGAVSRSATIEAFHRQEVLALILTISSNIGEEFSTQDTIILELLFYLLKGVDVEKLFMDKKQLRSKNSDELKSLLAQEAGMHRGYAKNAPTRHNRFGTMIWVKRNDAGKVSTVSGQDVLKDGQQTLSKMDQSKKWNKPRQRAKNEEMAYDRFDFPIPLTESAHSHLRAFVEEFLDSGFNPLFHHVRRAIEREAERVLEAHHQQFFYLISWFLEAERVRRRNKKEAEKKRKDKKMEDTFEADSFALIASVLNQESFILLNRFMQDRFDHKLWRELQAGMRCFTQILLIVQDMSESLLEEDQEIAENIQNRIFYEETTHDRIIAILRGYKDQGFGYLNACTELSHVFLRMLERYSRQNVDLQIRSRRRARKSKKAAAKQKGETNDDDGDDQASEMEDVAELERVSKERKFDFSRFSVKFMTQPCVDTFVAFTKYYSDLDADQLKRAHRFFYRVAFKQELSVMLSRLDIIALFYRMIKGPEGLDSKSSAYKEWDELVRQLIKKMIKKLDQRPELAIELLFSKINATTFYLENGYERQTTSSKPRPPATLEVRGSMTPDAQIGVVVAALYEDKSEQIDWVIQTLASAIDERQSWEAEARAREAQGEVEDPPDPNNPEQGNPPRQPPSITIIPKTEITRTLLFKDARLRLLLTLCGFIRLGIDDEPGATWIIPSSISSSTLRHTHEVVQQHRQSPTLSYGDEDPISAEDMLRRKPTEKAKRAEYDDDSEGDGIVSDGDVETEFLFPPGGPTNTNRRDALESLKKRRKRHHNDSEIEESMDEATREARRRAREKADLEKWRKIKSSEFVVGSDEESDEEKDREFFAREEARRRGQGERVREAFAAGRVKKVLEGEAIKPAVSSRKRKGGAAGDGKRRKRRKSSVGESNDEFEAMWRKDRQEDIGLTDDDMDDLNANDVPSPPPRSVLSVSSTEGGSDEEDDTPLSSPPLAPSKATEEVDVRRLEDLKIRKGQDVDIKASSGVEIDDEEDEEQPVSSNAKRKRLTVLDDSDDD